MAVIYATLIIKGVKKFSEVPDKIKDKVRQVLIDLECDHLIEGQARQNSKGITIPNHNKNPYMKII